MCGETQKASVMRGRIDSSPKGRLHVYGLVVGDRDICMQCEVEDAIFEF